MDILFAMLFTSKTAEKLPFLTVSKNYILKIVDLYHNYIYVL